MKKRHFLPCLDGIRKSQLLSDQGPCPLHFWPLFARGRRLGRRGRGLVRSALAEFENAKGEGQGLHES